MRASIFAHLQQVRLHSLTGSFRVMVQHCIEQAFVMELAPLRATLYSKDLLALLAEQVYDGVNETKNEDIVRSLSKSAVKVVIGGNEGIGIGQVVVHDRYSLAHGGDLFFSSSRRLQGSDFGFKILAHLQQILRAVFLPDAQHQA